MTVECPMLYKITFVTFFELKCQYRVIKALAQNYSRHKQGRSYDFYEGDSKLVPTKTVGLKFLHYVCKRLWRLRYANRRRLGCRWANVFITSSIFMSLAVVIDVHQRQPRLSLARHGRPQVYFLTFLVYWMSAHIQLTLRISATRGSTGGC